MTTKASLNARVKITAGPASGQFGRVAHADESTWRADVALDDGRTAKGIPMKYLELVPDEPVTDRSKLLDRIRKIFVKAESLKTMGPDYEAEALTAMAMAQKMLAKYKLSLDDLQMAAMEQEEPIGDSWEEGTGTKRQPWAESLAEVVARAHFCRVYFSTRATDRIYLVGRETDRKIAAFIYVTIKRAAEAMSDKAARQYRKQLRREQGATDWNNRNYRTAWLNGFVERIAERYREEEQQIDREQRTAGKTALVVVRQNALKQIDAYTQAKVKFSRTTKATRERYAGQSSSQHGARDGRSAANSVNIRGTGLGAAPSSNTRLLN